MIMIPETGKTVRCSGVNTEKYASGQILSSMTGRLTEKSAVIRVVLGADLGPFL